MCGIAGFVVNNQILERSAEQNISEIKIMTDAIVSRGPDDEGYWQNEQYSVVLGHRRLAILELSPAGHQPMVSENNRYQIVFNGEIYNHLNLRDTLSKQGYDFKWRGHSDTESILACFQVWGVIETLKQVSGMFAMAVWDQVSKQLFLARDPMGEKPLFYGWQQGVFLFGSELKALKANPFFAAKIDRKAIALLLRHNYIPAPFSIYQGIKKIMPGEVLVMDGNDYSSSIEKYWSLSEVALVGQNNRLELPENDLHELVHKTLRQSVSEQMLSDVPIGALLSGGLDSTTIVALMQDISKCSVKTFTIGFEEGGYDEACHAREIAKHLGTDHTELRLSSKDALDLIPLLPEIYDEPFADSSQLPTYLVMKLAKEHVSVALSGDGGDELFGGYNRYMLAPKLWQSVKWMPTSGRKAIGSLLQRLAVSKQMNGVARVTGNKRLNLLAQKFDKLSYRLKNIDSLEDIYESFVTEWTNATSLVKGVSDIPDYQLGSRHLWPKLNSEVEKMMLLDGLTYMPDDILTKVDRAAMAVSLETRAPFLNKSLIQLAWQIPLDNKIINAKGKQSLRTLLDHYVPRKMVERPKMGFGIPLDDWLRGPLRNWAGDLLAPDRLQKEGFFYHEPIQEIWLQHLQGKANHGYKLWSILMFQQWYEVNG